MKTKILLSTLLILASFCLVNCDRVDSTLIIKECPDFLVAEGTISDENEYRIVDAVLKNNFSRFEIVHVMNNREDVIIGRTLEEFLEFLLTADVELEKEIIESYLNINRNVATWKDSFEEGNLMGVEERNCFFADNKLPCVTYQNKYPNGSGFVNFTRPAYIENNMAIIEYLHQPCNGVEGVFVILNFENDNWEVVNFFTTIIS